MNLPLSEQNLNLPASSENEVLLNTNPFSDTQIMMSKQKRSYSLFLWITLKFCDIQTSVIYSRQ